MMKRFFTYLHHRSKNLIRFALVFSLLATTFVWMNGALAATAGPNFPGTGTNDTSVGTVAWSNPGFITANDTNLASATIGSAGISNYIFATNLAFAIPTGATINGVSVNISRMEGNTNARAGIEDSSVKLIVGGLVTGTEHAATTVAWPTTEAVATYGSTTDTWGATLTDTTVNATNFGVALSATDFKVSGGGGTETADVNYITITVTYTPVATTYAVPSSATQYLNDGVTVINVGGGSSQEQQTFSAVMTSPNLTDTLKLEFEAEPTNTPFTNVATLSSPGVACSGGTCTSGVTATVTATALAPGDYHWHVRTVSTLGSSAWQSYPASGTNAETATDFAVLAPSSLMRGGKTFIDETQTNSCATGSCQ